MDDPFLNDPLIEPAHGLNHNPPLFAPRMPVFPPVDPDEPPAPTPLPQILPRNLMPQTPHRDGVRHAEHERRALQMTSPSNRRRREPGPSARSPTLGSPQRRPFVGFVGVHAPHYGMDPPPLPPFPMPLLTPHQHAQFAWGPPHPHPSFMTAAQIQNRNRTHQRDAVAARREEERLRDIANRQQREDERAAARARKEDERRQRDAERAAVRAQREAEQAAARTRKEDERRQREEERAAARALREEQRQQKAAAQARKEEQQRRVKEKRTFLARVPYEEPSGRFSVGDMIYECRYCKALHWIRERKSGSSMRNPVFTGCCLEGQVRLPPLSDAPLTLRKLLTGQDPLSKEFRSNIRQYNSAMAFTSLGVNIDESVTRRTGPFCFRIHGALHHRLGPLQAPAANQPSYAQLYIHDPDEANRIRTSRNPTLIPQIFADLQDMLYNSHPYVNVFKQANQVMSEKPPEEQRNLAIRLQLKDGTDGRRYNLPTVDEIAAIIPGDGSETNISSDRDILLRLRDGGVQRISHLHPHYAPLHYVLLFPNGDDGWHTDIPLHPGPNGQLRTQSGKVSQTLYYAYRLYHRVREAGQRQLSSLLLGGKLLHQWIVDAWASTEQSKLNWVRTHQKELRAELYGGLRDALAQDDHSGNLEDTGKRVILPSSHPGSPRYMYQLFQDSMAICRYYQKPDIFLTMTANPNWPEIQAALPRNSDGAVIGTATDYPDIIARVFEQKKRSLLDDVKNGIFGKCVATVHTIEFQKRGLPHMHLLIFLSEQDRIRTPADVDLISCAQIPDPVAHPLLYETVTTSMLHGPCDHRCLKDGKCSKNFPKAFRDHTVFSADGYPELARPENGNTFSKPVRGQPHVYTNRDVVPYNPFLTAKYNCHINVEICHSIKAIKYIHKYIYKGHDRTTLEFQGDDEVQQYLDARYVSAIESCWRLLEFRMHAEEPSIYRLPVHLPDEQMVYYDPDDVAEDVLQRAEERDDRLTGWFKANRNLEEARQYTYQEFPQHFVWVPKSKQWKAREKGFAIGRMYFVSPSAGERFYLRLLLTVVKGAESFADLRTVDGVSCDTFHEACLKLGLLESDNEWIDCLQEAATMRLGPQMRALFVMILLHCHPAQPGVLWEQFKVNLCDDLRRRLEQNPNYNQEITDDRVQDYGLYLISEKLLEQGRSLDSFAGMPEVTDNWAAVVTDNYLLAEQLAYDRDALQHAVDTNVALCNAEQSAIYNAVLSSSTQNSGRIFFLQSAGGCGKTWVSNTIASALRAKGEVVLTVASSGIAALLLQGGRTAHSRFKIPIPATEESTCSISMGSKLGKVIERTKLIIWDELPMQHRFTVETLDRTLRHLMTSPDRPFGGITVLFSGDFRQTLPVIVKGTREQIVSASFRRSPLWAVVEVFHLTQNRRLLNEPGSADFAKWLLDVGCGKDLPQDNKLTLPVEMRCGDSIDDLIEKIYPDITLPGRTNQYFLQRSILACRNDDVDDINFKLLQKFPGVEKIYLSADKVVTELGAESPDFQPYPMEFLNSLKTSSLPLARLCLKTGCPLMLLRNLDPANGLCNGTRLRLLEMCDHVLRCQVLGGTHADKVVLIPRITLTPGNDELPLPLHRRQFPVRLAFSMTINKSQGQSMENVGLDLRTPVFSHGQLYVALSRCTSSTKIKVLFPEGEEGTSTTNIVYPEALHGLI